MTVTVAQTLTQIAVTAGRHDVADFATQAFTATATDQFGQALAAQPAFTWSVDTGGAGGTINASGLYTAPASGSGTDIVRATSGAVSGSAALTVIGPPTVASQAAAAPSTVIGTTTTLSVLGADAFYPSSELIYTWTLTAIPAGSRPPPSASTARIPPNRPSSPSPRRARTRSR